MKKDINGGESVTEMKGSDILESRIATMLPSLAKGNSTIGGLVGGSLSSGPPNIYAETTKPAIPDIYPEPPKPVVPDVYTPPPRVDPSVPRPLTEPERPIVIEDNGSSTPVMDEPDDEKESSVQSKQVPEKKPAAKTKTNPIDFLSQLLTKTSSSSSSSNFLQTLSLLTNTVKTQYNRQDSEGADIPKPEDDAKPPSPLFKPGGSQSVAAEFTGVPPPVPSTQASTWSGWKQVNTAGPDPSSPPVISQNKPPEQPVPPPLPQMPPPPDSLAPQPYGVQPPSPQDFSLPPPGMRPVVSQSFMNPPPPGPRPPPPQSSAYLQVSSTPTFSSQPIIMSSSVPPTSLATQGAGRGFNPSMPYGAGPGPNMARPPPPVSNPNQPGPPPGFIPRDPSWQPPRPPGPPPPTGPDSFNQYAPPPLPPDTRIPPPWQPDQPDNQPTNNGSAYNNQITPIPSNRPEWNSHSSSSFEEQNWEPDNENQSTGYQHPWNQPNFDDDDEDADFADDLLETTLPSPPKSILRNNRKSSLREVTLVEESSSSVTSVTDSLVSDTKSKYNPIIPQTRDQKPQSILKKPPPPEPAVSVSNDSTQSEFINMLKQKSGATGNLPDPPANRNIPDLLQMPVPGEQINTIGVLGNSGNTSSVKSDDMDLDNDDPHDQGGNVNNWRGEERWEEHARDSRRDFDRPDYNSPRPPHWAEPHNRHWRPRSPDRGGHDRGFHPHGGFPRPPRFPDSYRGPSPAKRPYFPPRPRNPYYRY